MSQQFVDAGGELLQLSFQVEEAERAVLRAGHGASACRKKQARVEIKSNKKKDFFSIPSLEPMIGAKAEHLSTGNRLEPPEAAIPPPRAAPPPLPRAEDCCPNLRKGSTEPKSSMTRRRWRQSELTLTRRTVWFLLILLKQAWDVMEVTGSGVVGELDKRHLREEEEMIKMVIFTK